MNRLSLVALLVCPLLFACQSRPHSLWGAGPPTECGWAMAGPGEFVPIGPELETRGGMGLLWFTEKEYRDFRLELEWKVVDRGHNSGIFVRFPDPGEDPWIAVRQGYEMQIHDEGGPDTKTGSVYDIQGPTSMPTKAVGQWNHYAIQAEGHRYRIWINGELVNDFTGDRNLRGHIGLQNHDEGSQVRFRNIRVEEL